MKKIIITLVIVILIILSGFYFIFNKYKINNTDKTSTGIVSNISSGIIEKKQIDKLGSIGKTNKEVVDSFYSSNKEKKEKINNWLLDKKNERTSNTGDIIEFLDYCEKLIKLKNNDSIKKLIKDNDFEDYNELIGIEYFKKNRLDSENVYKYFKDHTYDINRYNASYSISLIYSYLDNVIDRQQFIDGYSILNTKSIYDELYIEYLNNYSLKDGCSGIIDKTKNDF